MDRDIATYNVRFLNSDEELVEREQELQNMKWDVTDLSDVKMRACFKQYSG